MKICFFLIFTWSSLFFGCHKNNDQVQILDSPFAGTYKGSVIDTLFDSPAGIDTDYVIKINSTTVAGQVTLTNSPIQADTAITSGNIFTIAKKITIDIGANVRNEEFASGFFSGPNSDTLRAVFNSNNYKATNGTIGSLFKRTCVFVKQ